MRAGLATTMVLTAAAIVALALPALAEPRDDQQLANINRRLSALTTAPEAAPAPQPARVVVSPTLQTAAMRPGVAQLPAFMTRPQLMRLVSHFQSVDRMMHYHSRGLDANFWGVFNHGKGLSIKFTRTF
jgi:hypothetical protein